jgi:HAD superfamily hydrolase (TIGR01509 family)
MIKGIIFDMDGTLVHNMHFHDEAWLAFFKNHGLDMSHEELATVHQGTAPEMLRVVFGKDVQDQTIKQYALEKEALYRELFKPHVKAIYGLYDFLDAVKTNGIKTALATMGGKNNIQFLLSELKVLDYFDVILGGEDVSKGKPHPEIFNTALNKLNISNDEAFIFEDSHSGIQAALASNTKTVGIIGTLTYKDLTKYSLDYIFSDYCEAMVLIGSSP